MPKLTVKNECPSAKTIEEGVRSSKRGLNKKEMPCMPPSSVTPRTANTAKRTMIDIFLYTADFYLENMYNLLTKPFISMFYHYSSVV